MSGLDKMKSQILEDASSRAGASLAKAAADAKKIEADIKAEVEAKKQKMRAQTEASVKNYEERIASSCEMQRKKALLNAKQEMIAEVLEEAYMRVVQLPKEAYFSMLKDLLKQYVRAADGQMYLSEKDLERKPDTFDSEIQDIAAEHGGSLQISSAAREMDGGFILVYGGIEENCTIRAMFDAKREELSDLVQKVLY